VYFIDARHLLDEKGAIAARKGPARALAEFCGGVIAHATDVNRVGMPAPNCFKCRKAAVEVTMADNAVVCWSCARCGTEGEISHWQGTLWDLRHGAPPNA
jgi:hypothetical protein